MADTKVCSRCKVSKPTSEFHTDRRAPTGFRSACKVCISKGRRGTGPRGPEIVKRGNNQRNAKALGMPVDVYERNIMKPCELCGAEAKPDFTNSVYMSRSTGKGVAVTCRPCASGLGFLGHSPERMLKAIELVNRTEQLK